ncbi:antibiotic biosynthesis monooxygenase family protein [Lentibacter sp.]|uniref:antibiotic biosynthesis monooxygenase family protein n=1 Tax=Lentibacter sp. TaxID=2024994 RepID=UPI003F69BD71
MPVFSQMSIALRPGVRDAAIKAFRERRVLEECAQSIPGFISARLLLPLDAPDAICVMAEWQGVSDFEAWTRHPLRDAQEADLVHFLAAPPVTTVFQRALVYDQPQKHL